MNLIQKPFVCYHKGCEMTFTNEDHLHVHKKKHKMALHLGIDNQNSNLGADQTPTPTRFIRNCEEVGLFQDLQNVNPFEETFRKATELVKSGSLHLPKEATDDTLHTPHFSPSIEHKSLHSNNKCSVKKECEFSNVALKNDTISEKNKVDTNEVVITKLGNVPEVVGHLSCKNNSNIQELRKTVMDTLKLKLQNNVKKENVKVNAINLNGNVKQTRSNSDTNHHLPYGGISKIKLDRVREINRHAQLRSREKKKSWITQMSKEIESLKKSKVELNLENQNLKSEISLLKSMLLYHQDCSASKDPKIAEKINELVRKSHENKEIEKISQPVTSTSIKKTTLLHPKVATIALVPNAILVPLPLITNPATITNDSVKNQQKLLSANLTNRKTNKSKGAILRKESVINNVIKRSSNLEFYDLSSNLECDDSCLEIIVD